MLGGKKKKLAHKKRETRGGSGEIHLPSSCAFILQGSLFFFFESMCVNEIQSEVGHRRLNRAAEGISFCAFQKKSLDGQ